MFGKIAWVFSEYSSLFLNCKNFRPEYPCSSLHHILIQYFGVSLEIQVYPSYCLISDNFPCNSRSSPALNS